MNELQALANLASFPHLGSLKTRLLLRQFGSAMNALRASSNEIGDLPGFGPKITSYWDYWKTLDTWKENFELAEKNDIQMISFTDPLYPKRLLETYDFPILLYVAGELKPRDQQSIAIVGTRQASLYGMKMAEKLAHELTVRGFTIVSGLARGIDTASHQGALYRGRTIAVIGSGLNDIYPPENLRLADTIRQKGALISEWPMNTPPDRQNFPQRNRIVSGMTMATILVEAPLKSGAMLTLEKGFTQGRKLFALPGRADDENFRGNHQMIKEGKAQLVESAQDVVDYFDNLFATSGYDSLIPRKDKPPLEEEEQHLLKQLPVHDFSISEVANLTQLPTNKLNGLLMSLILKKVIKEFPGKIYKKVSEEGLMSSSRR